MKSLAVIVIILSSQILFATQSKADGVGFSCKVTDLHSSEKTQILLTSDEVLSAKTVSRKLSGNNTLTVQVTLLQTNIQGDGSIQYQYKVAINEWNGKDGSISGGSSIVIAPQPAGVSVSNGFKNTDVAVTCEQRSI